MPRVLLNFQLYGGSWTVHFIQDDCRSSIGPRTRYYRLATLDSLRSFVVRCQPEDATLAGFERKRPRNAPFGWGGSVMDSVYERRVWSGSRSS
jgi:hypothetical protein